MKASSRISIAIPTNFSFQETLSFLDRDFDECLYHLSSNTVSKVLQLSDGNALIKIYQEKEKLQIEVLKNKISKKNLAEVEAFVLEWFDLERDLEVFYKKLSKHDLLSNFPKRYAGSRLIGIPNLFEAICWAIIGQQINLKFAYKLKRSLVEKYGEKLIINHLNYYIFPSPEILAKADRTSLVELKFSRQKIDYLKNISHAFVKHEVSKPILLNCKNKAARIAKLTAIKGIGIWTANYVLMKSIRDMSCITYGDSGLNRALKIIFKVNKNPTKQEVDTIFKDFKNWESYLNFYLWKSLNP